MRFVTLDTIASKLNLEEAVSFFQSGFELKACHLAFNSARSGKL
jgi:hypothetical protein